MSEPSRQPLGQLDPLAIPLPHGTDVTARVEKMSGERRIPQGVIGRVVRARDGGFDVLILGTGEVWYAREELLPRRAGQVAFAHRRALAWDALRPCVVLEAVVGSRAWGLANEGSDTDVRGIFALPFLWTLGLQDPPRDLVSADGSTSYWEMRKAIEQALRADPNTLELLFLDETRAVDPIGEWLIEERDAFVSREIFGSFGRYAVSQLRKLTRSHRLAEHREQILDWLRQDPAPDMDETARRLSAISPRPAPDAESGFVAAKEYVKQLYRSLYDQGVLKANDFSELVRHAREGDVPLTTASELRPKNAYNLLRLIESATIWLQSGKPQFRAEGRFRERLLAIKSGQVPLEDVLADAEAMVPGLEKARDLSLLPERPDVVRADRLLRLIGEEIARRHFADEPGPLGRDAPPVAPGVEETATQ